MDIHHVLIKPAITEKSTLLQESGKYTFHVSLKANKIEVIFVVSRALARSLRLPFRRFSVPACRYRFREAPLASSKVFRCL